MQTEYLKSIRDPDLEVSGRGGHTPVWAAASVPQGERGFDKEPRRVQASDFSSCPKFGVVGFDRQETGGTIKGG